MFDLDGGAPQFPTLNSLYSIGCPRAGVFNLGWGTRTPGGTWDLFRGYELEHHCRICIILLEKVGVDCMWSAEPIGDVHFTAS